MWKSFLLLVCITYLVLVYKYVNRTYPFSSIQSTSQFTIDSLSQRTPLYIQQGKQLINQTTLHTFGRVFYNKKKNCPYDKIVRMELLLCLKQTTKYCIYLIHYKVHICFQGLTFPQYVKIGKLQVGLILSLPRRPCWKNIQKVNTPPL